jgi:Uma2 family endonuclease
MNIQSPVRMDKQAFLAWAQTQEERHELDRGRILMMTGGSRAHWQITLNLAKALDARLPPENYAVLPEFGIDLEVGSIRFPDVVVDVAGEASKDLTATSPVLIAEVLSPASERIDLGDKAAEYLRLPNLPAYLVLAQDEVKVWMWTREGAGFPAGPAVFDRKEDVIPIEPLGINLPLEEVYARVRFE